MEPTTMLKKPRSTHQLTDVLLRFSDNDADAWRLRDACQGVQIFGGIGSGKTSGSGRTIAKAFLESGYGGLVLTAKPDEAELWQHYAEMWGRADDLIMFSEGSQWQFNPLQYETTRGGKGSGLTFNLTELFMAVFKMGQRLSGSTAEEKEQFWSNSLRRCLNRVIDLLKLAEEELSIANMVNLLTHAPNGSETRNRIDKIKKPDDYLAWAEKDYFIYCLCTANANVESQGQVRDFELCRDYFLKQFCVLDERVRSTIQEMFFGFCEPFLSGILNDHFAGETNLSPELTFEGKIIVLDFAVMDYLISGLYAQTIYKLLWQQAVGRRQASGDNNIIPVFLWIDESTYFINEMDSRYQATARSSRACTVFLTQNISNYYGIMGGDQAKAKVDSLLGNLGTKIFHSSNDSETNTWASKVIGDDIKAMEGGHHEMPSFSFNITRGESFTMQLMPQIIPVEFTTLKSGGEENAYEVQGIISINGRQWSNGKNYRRVIFKQRS